MSNQGGRQLGWQVIPPPDSTINHGAAAATFLTARQVTKLHFFCPIKSTGIRVIKEMKEAGDEKLYAAIVALFRVLRASVRPRR